jgi:hypothetical protein
MIEENMKNDSSYSSKMSFAALAARSIHFEERINSTLPLQNHCVKGHADASTGIKLASFWSERVDQ